MSRASTATAVPISSLADAFEVVRRSGQRMSTARRILLEVLGAADRPLSAEVIASGLGGRHPSSDLASTYRNLETLEELGLVRHVHLGHGPGLYALSGPGDREYIVCERCDAVRSIQPAALDGIRDEIRRRFGHEARFAHFPLGGLCAACAAATEDDTGGTASSVRP